MRPGREQTHDGHPQQPPPVETQARAPRVRQPPTEAEGSGERREVETLKEVGADLSKSVEHFGNQLRSAPMQLADNFKALVDAISELIAQHIKLARVELKEDVTQIGTNVGKIAAFIPLLIFGYLLLCVAGALFLTRYLPVDVSFLIVAGVNLGVGAIGILLAVRNLKQRKVLSRTKAELQSTALVFKGSRS